MTATVVVSAVAFGVIVLLLALRAVATELSRGSWPLQHRRRRTVRTLDALIGVGATTLLVGLVVDVASTLANLS